MFEPADNPDINSLQAPSDAGFYALIVGDILTESRKYFQHTNIIEHGVTIEMMKHFTIFYL